MVQLYLKMLIVMCAVLHIYRQKQDGHLMSHMNSNAVGDCGGGGKPPPDEHNAIPSFDKALSDVHEKAMQVT